jgi:hypothetical protein
MQIVDTLFLFNFQKNWVNCEKFVHLKDTEPHAFKKQSGNVCSCVNVATVTRMKYT